MLYLCVYDMFLVNVCIRFGLRFISLYIDNHCSSSTLLKPVFIDQLLNTSIFWKQWQYIRLTPLTFQTMSFSSQSLSLEISQLGIQSFSYSTNTWRACAVPGVTKCQHFKNVWDVICFPPGSQDLMVCAGKQSRANFSICAQKKISFDWYYDFRESLIANSFLCEL